MTTLRPILLLAAALTLSQCASTPAISPFQTDGCTLFPDQSLHGEKNWHACCVAHDYAYWKGGTEAERLAADEKLRDCVYKQTGDSRLAELVFKGVRAGGGPYFPTPYRWGYGWNYLRPAGPLTEEEKALIAAQEARSGQALNSGK